MNLYYLTIELIIDAIAAILGILLIIRKTDNHPKFYWGVIATLIGFVFIEENIGWLITRSENPLYQYRDILNIEKMLEWYVLASLVSLYPLSSLHPGYLTPFRLTACLFPPAIITTIGISYLCFNGHITPLNAVSQIAANMDQPDVRLRLTIFLFTIITPLLYFSYPLLRNKSRRKINRMMYFFIGFMFLLLGVYILFTLFINDFIFNGFGITAIVFSIFFSIQYLRVENPLSDHVEIDHKLCTENDIKENVGKQSLIVASPLYEMIDNYLKESHMYVDSNYSIENLASHFGEKEAAISIAIKSSGYSGFREYINHLRLEYFKYQVTLNPHRTVKELMSVCGFISRTTFYRLYSDKYHENPMKFIDKQTNKE